MDGRKRKLNSKAQQPKNTIKKFKVVETKAKLEEKKVPLKTIFKKVRNGVYVIKEAKKNPTNSDAEVDVTANNATDVTSNGTTICSQIPDFTNEDIAELIDCTDLTLFMDNFPLDDNAACDALALLQHPTSTPADPNLITTVHIENNLLADRIESSTKNEPPNPMLTLAGISLDTDAIESFIEKYKSSNPTLTPSNNMPNIQIMNSKPHSVGIAPDPTICSSDEYAASTTRNQFEIPMANLAVTCDRNNRTADNESTNGCSSTATRFEAMKNITKQQQLHMVPKSSAKLLEEILGLQMLTPTYRLRSLTDSIFQCHVRVKDQHAYGTGKCIEDAKNSAALSLLNKLISTKFFGNIIGRLQELCMTVSWPLPKYSEEVIACAQIKNEIVFIVACSVKQFREFGQGRTKKMAKLFAAFKMWCKLTSKNFVES